MPTLAVSLTVSVEGRVTRGPIVCVGSTDGSDVGSSDGVVEGGALWVGVTVGVGSTDGSGEKLGVGVEDGLDDGDASLSYTT